MVARHGEVPHLASRASVFFAVQMQMGARVGIGSLKKRLSVGPTISEKIDHCYGGTGHGRIAERLTNKCSHLLLKLAGIRRIKCPVAAVVRARCKFVDEESVVGNKELHGKHAHVVKFFCNLGCCQLALIQYLRIEL